MFLFAAVEWEELARFLGIHAMGALVAAVLVALLLVALGQAGFEAAGRVVLRFAARLRPRQEPESLLAIHLAAGLLLALAGVALFTLLADNVEDKGAVTRFDMAFAEALHENATFPKLVAFREISWLANLWTLALLTALVGSILAWKKERLRCAGWISGIVGAGLLNTALKAAFHRLRPHLPNPFITESGWSFPSGHAMGSLVAWGMLAYLINTHLRRESLRRLVTAAAVILIVLIGFSRIYLTVHYFSDVVAGYAAGSFWLLICAGGVQLARARQKGKPLTPDHPSPRLQSSSQATTRNP